MTGLPFSPLRSAIEHQAEKLPGVSRDIKWGAVVVYSVAGKMFCCLSPEHEAAPRISIKVASDRFLELTDQPGIRPAPYLAKHHWISIEPAAVLGAPALLHLLTESYQLVRAKLPKKVQLALAPFP